MSSSPNKAPAATMNALDVSCPVCGAAAGETCRRPKRYEIPPNTSPHRAREIKASHPRTRTVTRRLAGTPLEARILAIADAYDAPTAARLTGAGQSTVYRLLRQPRAIDLPPDFKRDRR